ncbi:MAG: aminotransferase class V-fold PLP-dependent enzyme [Candidatus Thorarchaeota archaeon]
MEFLSETVSSSRRGAHMLAIRGGSIVEETRKKLAGFMSVDHPQISFQKSITSSVASFALGYDWKKKGKDTILVAASEEHSILVALQRVSQLLNLEIKPIPIDDQGVLDLGSLENLLTKRVGIVAVGSTTIGWGIRNPLRAISNQVHEYDGMLLSDVSRSFGYDIRSLVKSGPDLIVTSANTSFMAPPGLAIQWIEESLGAQHIPGILGGSSVSNVSLTEYEIALQPDKFESDVLNVPAIAGLSAAIAYLSSIDMTKIQSHFKELAVHTLRRANEIENLNLFGHPDELSTIFGFNLGDDAMISCHDISLFLDESHIATRSGLLCAHPLVKRASFEGIIQTSYGLYNSVEEIDLLFDTLGTISKDLL